MRLRIAWMEGAQPIAFHVSSEMTVTSAPESMLRVTGFPSTHRVTAQGSSPFAEPSRAPRKTSVELPWTPPTLADLHTAWKRPFLLHFLQMASLGYLTLSWQGSCQTWNTPWGYQGCGLSLHCSDCPGSCLASSGTRLSSGRHQRGSRFSRAGCSLEGWTATASRLRTGGPA